MIIIGAGISGLMAAYSLIYNYNYKDDIYILEASDRIGGRICTLNVNNNIKLDMGASWIHNIKVNPIYEITKKYNIQTKITNYQDNIIFSCFGSNNTYFKCNNKSNTYSIYRESLLNKFLSTSKNYNSDLSFLSAYDKYTKNHSLSSYNSSILRNILNTEIEHEYNADLSDLSFLHYSDHINDQPISDIDAIIPDGYDFLPKLILSLLPSNVKIIYNTYVYKINISTGDIFTNKNTFRSNTIICSIPLGVLKSGNIRFVNNLPEWKQDAINGLGMGTYNKCYLEYPYKFWDDISFINSVDLSYKDNNVKFSEWLNLDKYINKPIICGFNGGKYAHDLENLSDYEITNIAHNKLKSLYKINKDIPYPINSYITRWSSNPYSYGSYSYIRTGSDISTISDMAETINSNIDIHFIGEHTSMEFPQTVHGAYLTGMNLYI